MACSSLLLFFSFHLAPPKHKQQQQQLKLLPDTSTTFFPFLFIYPISNLAHVQITTMSDAPVEKKAPAATVEDVKDEDAPEPAPAPVDKDKGKEAENGGGEQEGDAPAEEENPYAGMSEDEIKAKVETLVAEGKKAVALKQWEEGVAKYGEALEAQQQLVGNLDPTMAPLLYSYGRALFELTLTQQGVMGKEEVAKNTTVKDDTKAGSSSGAAAANPNFVFEGDGDDDDEEEEEEEQGAANANDEDDFNAAWDVLDVARTIYGKELDKPDLTDEQKNSLKLTLANCYAALGDISLETENFPQAVQDYTAALELQKSVLPESARALASSHYQLGTVLEFSPAGRPAALKHIQAALDSFKLRAKELEAAAAGKTDEVKSADVTRMSAKERENESKDVATLIGDLEAKIEELNAGPPPEDFVAETINHLLGGGISSSSSSAPVADSAPVNDLTSMVRKKKKPAPATPAPAAAAAAAANGNGAAVEKRPAQESAEGVQKKPKTE